MVQIQKFCILIFCIKCLKSNVEVQGYDPGYIRKPLYQVGIISERILSAHYSSDVSCLFSLSNLNIYVMEYERFVLLSYVFRDK